MKRNAQLAMATPADYSRAQVSDEHFHFRNTSSERIAAEKTIDRLAAQSDEVLLSIRSVFPFDLFPDQLTVDKNKVTVVSRVFFGSGEVRAVPIQYIAEVIVEANIFFATVTIQDQKYDTNPIVVKHLSKQDALTAQKIIQGLVIAENKKINLSNVNQQELADKAAEMGKPHHRL